MSAAPGYDFLFEFGDLGLNLGSEPLISFMRRNLGEKFRIGLKLLFRVLRDLS
jgi:hypothetical protein